MSDSNVHVGTHPSGHPNKTAVNADNPIFGRPADPIPAVSIQQAGVVQSEKNPRETVQSPLINEEVASPVTEADPSLAGDGGDTEPASDSQITSGDAANQPQDSHPSAEDLDAVAADNAAREATAKDLQIESEGPETPNQAADSQFATGQKVRFTPESGNDTTEVNTINGGQVGEDGTGWFWRLDEKPGSLFLGQNLMPAGLE